MPKSKEEKALESGKKIIETDLKKYRKHLEGKIDFKEIQRNLEELRDQHAINDPMYQSLDTLVNYLKNGKKEDFMREVMANTPYGEYDEKTVLSHQEQFGHTFSKLTFAKNEKKLGKLYDVYLLQDSLHKATLEKGFQDVRNKYNDVVQDLTKHDKKDRNFLQKIGHGLKKFFLIPHNMYSKGNFAFWKSRAELLGERLKKAETKFGRLFEDKLTSGGKREKRKGKIEDMSILDLSIDAPDSSRKSDQSSREGSPKSERMSRKS